MESLVVDPAFWRNKRVLLTGHTGFKGGWLALWLQKMQAQVFGLALAPATKPSLFELADIAEDMHSDFGDITDFARVQECFQQARPDIVIHMAAQALVRYAYQQPLQTYQTNVIGTLHVLECIRQSETVKAAVLVTTDKCYENREWGWPYRENDSLGGYDPYSSSKACMELLVASYRNSYFSREAATAIATVRAGNVIGGGDWSEDRLLPDLIKAVNSKQAIHVRSPNAVRPWQHVLEPLSGYLILAERLFLYGHDYAEAWNFGPGPEASKSVRWIIEQVAGIWPDLDWQIDAQTHPHEANILKLDCSKARERLSWHGKWSLQDSLSRTLEWYQVQMTGINMKRFTLQQISDYQRLGEF